MLNLLLLVIGVFCLIWGGYLFNGYVLLDIPNKEEALKIREIKNSILPQIFEKIDQESGKKPYHTLFWISQNFEKMTLRTNIKLQDNIVTIIFYPEVIKLIINHKELVYSYKELDKLSNSILIGTVWKEAYKQ